jgi:cobalamin biosynthesis protein CobD/CbiB
VVPHAGLGEVGVVPALDFSPATYWPARLSLLLLMICCSLAVASSMVLAMS